MTGATTAAGDDRLRTIDGVPLEVEVVGADAGLAGALVLLHEGLGCRASWRDLPARLHARTGRAVVVGSRQGYGRSRPWSRPPGPRFLHDEATVALPALVAALGVTRPVLLGHSDGASIALVAAGSPPLAAQVAGVAALAPHLFVEDETVAAIAALAARAATERVVERLARHHVDAAATFAGWTGVWLAPAFRALDLTAEVAASTCPILAVQGDADEYGTLAQLDRLVALRPDARRLILPGVGHHPHLQAPAAVEDALVGWLADLPR